MKSINFMLAISFITLILFQQPVFMSENNTTYKDSEYKLIDNYHDTWASVDGAGRALPDYEQVGEQRSDKFVGIFYWTWHIMDNEGKAFNINNFMKKSPEAIYDFNHPLWPQSPTSYYWNEPLFGFYRTTDRWVLRKHAQQLANAGVDVVIFDCTNGSFTWDEGYLALLEEFSKAREDGIKTPQIAFMLNFGPLPSTSVALNNLYSKLYKPGIYKDLWFYWKGKPLILAYPDALDLNTPSDNKEINEEIKKFFTFRKPQALCNTGPFNNEQWGWLEIYPQNKYVVSEDGSCEQVTVGVAQNLSSVDKKLIAMNAPYSMSRSYTDAYGHDLSPDAYKYGYNFQEQWDRALDIDPEFIFITGWNEWRVGRHSEWAGQKNAFPDTFDNNRSRDIEPMKGGFGDNYYYQMVANIRRFKGVRPAPIASVPKTISIDASKADWQDVKPEFINDKGMILHRNSNEYLGYTYQNTTGRNNITLSKVSRDDKNIYFYAKTNGKLTSFNDEKWMRLFINSDRNAATGWEGYDYVVNRVKPKNGKLILEHSVREWD